MGISARFRQRVTVNERAISSFFQPGGSVFSEMQQFNREWKATAIVKAPKRTGNLASKHSTRTLPGGIYGCHAVLLNDAYYSTFVHDGTKGPIYARGYNGRLKIPYTGGGFGRQPARPGAFMLKRSVRGQKPQPWMVDALQTVMRKY